MTLENIVKLYNPDNAGNLKPEEVQAMQSLTDTEIKALAEAYPNNPRGNSYLILFDTTLPLNKQLFALSTWKNLYSVRHRSGLKNLRAYTFRSIFNQPKNVQPGSKVRPSKVEPKVAAPIDLAGDTDLPGMEKKPEAKPEVKTATTTAAVPAPATVVKPTVDNASKGDKKAPKVNVVKAGKKDDKK